MIQSSTLFIVPEGGTHNMHNCNEMKTTHEIWGVNRLRQHMSEIVIYIGFICYRVNEHGLKHLQWVHPLGLKLNILSKLEYLSASQTHLNSWERPHSHCLIKCSDIGIYWKIDTFPLTFILYNQWMNNERPNHTNCYDTIIIILASLIAGSYHTIHYGINIDWAKLSSFTWISILLYTSDRGDFWA
jgi:hypothetical protein